MIRCGGGEDPASGCRLRADSDHNPRKGVAKDFLPNDGVKERHRLAAWFYKANYNVAVAWPQHSRRNFDNSRKVGRIANRPDAFRPVPHIHPEMLCSAERARQRLALWQPELAVAALAVERAVVWQCPLVPWRSVSDAMRNAKLQKQRRRQLLSWQSDQQSL
jgi:hypothetical protein